MQNVVSLKKNEFRFHYRKCGTWNGETPIFFLGGAFQSMDSWRKFERYFLGRNVPVLLADLPGIGQADLLPESYGIDFLAEATADIIRHSEAGKVHLVSASYGSPIAYMCCESHPQLVESLILTGIMKKISDSMRPAVEQHLRTLDRGDMEQFAREGVENGLLCRDRSKPVDRRKLSEQILFQGLLDMCPAQQRRYSANTKRLLKQKELELNASHEVPTLVFTGEHDTFTTPEECREVARSIRRCWFTTVRRADHLVHIEQFASTARLIQSFTRGHRKPVPGTNGFEFVGSSEYVGSAGAIDYCPLETDGLVHEV